MSDTITKEDACIFIKKLIGYRIISDEYRNGERKEKPKEIFMNADMMDLRTLRGIYKIVSDYPHEFPLTDLYAICYDIISGTLGGEGYFEYEEEEVQPHEETEEEIEIDEVTIDQLMEGDFDLELPTEKWKPEIDDDLHQECLSVGEKHIQEKEQTTRKKGSNNSKHHDEPQHSEHEKDGDDVRVVRVEAAAYTDLITADFILPEIEHYFWPKKR